jgi:protein archease
VKRFDIIEHTADVGIVAYGVGLGEAFANAAYAMFTLIADLGGVREEVCREVEVQAEDRESLLPSWLNELLYLFDTEGIIFKRFEVSELGESNLKAKGYGEPLDPERHSLKAGVKAATYYMLRVAKEDDGYSVQVIFDM